MLPFADIFLEPTTSKDMLCYWLCYVSTRAKIASTEGGG